MSLPRFSINQIVLVNLVFLVVIVAGLQVARQIPVEIFPDISFNTTVITTLWSGASADEVERLVTSELEEEMEDINGIREMRSISGAGMSQIYVSWDETLSQIDYESGLNDVRAALERVGDLPEGADEPILTELSVGEVSPAVMIVLADEGEVGEYTLREVARSYKSMLERLAGVRKVTMRGDREREIVVFVDKIRAHQFDLTLAEISQIIARNNQNVPGGSFTNLADQEITVRGMGQFVSPERLADTVVRKSPDGNHVRLEEVAEIRAGFEKRQRYGRFNGNPAVMLGVVKASDAGAIDLVAAVRGLIEKERATLPPGIASHVTWDTSRYIRARFDIMRSNLALGIVFVVVTLWLSVGFRNALLAIVGVPFAFLLAMTMFPLFGITINSLSLVGFVMVSGMLVDDAIIILENIYRHVEDGVPWLQAIVHGTEEVMWPVTAAVATTIAAFLPMLLVTGPSGKFMEILPKTVIVCLLASLFEALVILPAHYHDFGTRKKSSVALAELRSRAGVSSLSYRLRERIDQAIDRVRTGYAVVQARVLEHRMAFLVLCIAAFYFAVGLSKHVPVNLFPGDFNSMFAVLESPVDYGIEQTNAVAQRLETALEDLSSELTAFTSFSGQGMTADDTPIFAPNFATFYIRFPNTRGNIEHPERVLNLVRQRLEEAKAENPQGIESLRVAKPRQGPAIGRPVAIRIQTEDYDLAKQLAEEVKSELATIEGVYDIEDNVPVGPRELRVTLDEDRASIHGLTFDQVGAALRAANDGLVPSTFRDPKSDEDVDIRVLLREDQRRSVADLVDVEVRTPAGYRVKVGDVASLELARGYQRLYHYDVHRAVVVYAQVDEQKTTSVAVNEIMQARFADVTQRHPEVTMIYGGEFEQTKDTMVQMRRALLVALLAIYAILAAQFRSYVQPLVVMSVVGFAYIGVVVGMWVLGYSISMYVLYALVGLAGIVVNDSLVLIDFANNERARGVAALEAIRSASLKRFRPILLTTLTTIAGLAPMALGLGGRSPVFAPFAAAIVFGLGAASLLTLFVVPALYLVVEGVKRRVGVSPIRTATPLESR